MAELTNAIVGGLFDLHFSDENLEKEFTVFSDTSNRHSNQIGTIAAAISWAIVILYTFLFYRARLVIVSLPILILQYPLFVVELILMSKPRYVKFYQVLCSIGVGSGAVIAIILLFLVLKDPLAGTLFLVGSQMFAFFVLRLRHTLAAATTLLYTAICQLVLIVSWLYDVKYLVLISFAIWVFEIVLLVAGRELEMATRRYYSEEKVKSQLLTSILPLSVAEELQLTGSSRPVRIESATILFSDFVHFTRATKGIDPISVVAFLTGYFTAFDYMAEKHRVERLKTIGDGYMCAAGVPDISKTHPIDVCLLALDMLRHVKSKLQEKEGMYWDIRIGINTGSVTAGMIGKSKFSYDIWGESVNVASSHESSGIEGGINVSKSTYLLTRSFFDYQARGKVEIKGGEQLDMYELVGVKPKYVGESGLNQEYYDIYGKLAKGEMLLGFDV